MSPGSTNEWPDVAELETQRVEAGLKEIEQFRSSEDNGNAADLEQLVVMLKPVLVLSSMNHTETELVTERGFLETRACAGTGEMAYCIKSLLC